MRTNNNPTAKLTAEAVEILVKSISVDRILGIGVAMSDMDYPTTADEIAWAFACKVADYGLRASTADRLRKLYPRYDNTLTELVGEATGDDAARGYCESSKLHDMDGDYVIYVTWSLHILPDTGEWLVVVDSVDDRRLMSEEDYRKDLEELGFTFD